MSSCLELGAWSLELAGRSPFLIFYFRIILKWAKFGQARPIAPSDSDKYNLTPDPMSIKPAIVHRHWIGAQV